MKTLYSLAVTAILVFFVGFSSSSVTSRDSRSNSILVNSPHFRELIEHPDFSVLRERFEMNSLYERREAVKEAFVAVQGVLKYSSLRKPLIIALFKELQFLAQIDLDGLMRYITREAGLRNLILDLRGSEWFLAEGDVEEAVAMKKFLNSLFSSKFEFSNPMDERLLAIIRPDSNKFFDIFTDINADTLPVLLETGVSDERLVQLLLGDDETVEPYFSQKPKRLCNILLRACNTWPEVMKYQRQLLHLFDVLDERRMDNYYLDLGTLPVAFYLRGLRELEEGVEFDVKSLNLIDAALLGKRFDLVVDALAKKSDENLLISLVHNNAEFLNYLLNDREALMTVVNAGNVLKLMSKSVLLAFHGVSSMLELFESLDPSKPLSSLIRVVGRLGSAEEIRAYYPKLLTQHHQWSFFSRFVEENNEPDFPDSLAFLLAFMQEKRMFGERNGRHLTWLSAEKYALILARAPQLFEQLVRFPLGCDFQLPEEDIKKLLQDDATFQSMTENREMVRGHLKTILRKYTNVQMSPVELTRIKEFTF